jgi:hypothetical protein
VWISRRSGDGGCVALENVRICRVEGGYARPDLPQMMEARNCRVEGGYARPDLPPTVKARNYR